MEADFQRFYDLSLPHVLVGGEWRRLKVLLEHLPGDSATARTTRPENAWGSTEYLLALLVDQGNNALWQRGGGKGRRPKPLRRPGDRPDRMGTASMTPEELKKRLRRG